MPNIGQKTYNLPFINSCFLTNILKRLSVYYVEYIADDQKSNNDVYLN